MPKKKWKKAKELPPWVLKVISRKSWKSKWYLKGKHYRYVITKKPDGKLMAYRAMNPRFARYVKSRRRSFTFYKIRKTLRYMALIPLWLVLSFIPLLVGLGVIYLLDPSVSMVASLLGTTTTFQLLISAFLFPAEAGSLIPWVAWIVSGFVGGLIFRRVLIPFLSTYGLAWLIFYFFGGKWLIGLIGGDILVRVIALNAFIALLAFGFAGFFGSAIRR